LSYPFLYRTVETKEVFHLLPDGEDRFPIRTIKIDEEKLIIYRQDIFKLEVSMIEPCLMELSKEKASGSDGFSLMRKLFK
jgi:hypothetical protein